MQPESIKCHLTPAQVGALVAGNTIVLPEGTIRIEIVMESVANKPQKCPYEHGTEDYYRWWESHHKIAIAEMNLAREVRNLHRVRHDFDKNRKCRRCGIGEIDALGRPNVCVPKCIKHIPPGYAPCTREPGHDGPCAHPLACNLCGQALGPGERENHDRCVADEYRSDQ